ncbi:uncharacterized protein C8Q71DRAFT_908084 [Rhodofomes roseus]|uniref:Uncharacterized protein n=1 Tax=Rhodofomes roseus TaxID=34475 RepID=A0ABQ8KE97_9APHY|nr:uncharacterized protein C8Q71DRAFT_908084 [Rhodofomes roseus]KAH9835648.1 hypothetical protein C8Q71DRAFT_908084 [Rhodofomes roseus]
MSDNVNTPARNSHRKTFSFLSSSWFTSKPPLQPAAQHPTDSARDERRVDRTPTPAPPAASTRSRDTDDTSYPRTPHSPLSAHFLLPKPSLQNMRLARKVKKLNRDADDKSKSKQRPRVGDMLEDPYSLMTMSPGLLIPPSPSPSTTSFLDSEPRPRSLKRSATVGNQPSGHATGQSVGVQRARSIAALPSSLAPPDPHIAEPGERSLSPVIFAPREETSQPPSETSSALYSESLVPSKAPSLIEEEEEPPSPVSEVPTTAVSQRFRNISSDGTGEKSHARLASSTSSLSKATRASKDRAPADVSPHQQEPSGSSSSSQQAPPLIRRRSPSPRAIPVFDGDLLTNPSQRSLSLRRAQTSRSSRRLSLDLRNLSPEPFKGGPSRLKKSRSALATSSKRTLRPDAADELVDSYLSQSADEVEEPVDEKQHALNVRRAKKMMQLFGDKPPKELFQVRSHRIKDDMIDTISILTTVSENRRDSRATFTSVTSSISIRRRLRDSVQSSNSEPPSPLVFSPSEGLNGSRQGTPEDVKENVPAEPVEAKDNAQAEPEPQVEAEPHAATDAAPPATEQAPTGAAGTSISPSRPSVHSRPGTPVSRRSSSARPRSTSAGSYSRSRSHSRSHSLHSQAPFISEPLPPLPVSSITANPSAPFSDLVPSPPSLPPLPTSEARVDAEQLERERQDAVSPPPENFRARRIRAAKLSRFFGVAPRDLTDVLANGPPASPTFSIGPHSMAHTVHEGRPKTPRQDVLSSFGSKEMSSTPSLPLQHQPERSMSQERQDITVEVAADLPRPFRLGREKRPELDMEAVLDQLRRMR